MPAPGVRALVVLAATTVIGYLIGVIGFEDGAARWIKVARHAVLVGVVGSAFWSWAGRCWWWPWAPVFTLPLRMIQVWATCWPCRVFPWCLCSASTIH